MELKQSIRSGDDVLDFRTGLGFEQWQGIDQNALIGNEFGSLLQFCQCCAGRDALLENGARFQLDCGRQQRKVVVRLIRAPNNHDLIFAFLRHVISLCCSQRQVNKICRKFLIFATYQLRSSEKGSERRTGKAKSDEKA
ncbi:MAG: hypothetical protein ABTQ25_14280 [Nitrosomonas ureae]